MSSITTIAVFPRLASSLESKAKVLMSDLKQTGCIILDDEKEDNHVSRTPHPGFLIHPLLARNYYIGNLR